MLTLRHQNARTAGIALGALPGFDAESCPWWRVTVPTRRADGATGNQTFTVRGRTAQAALARAAVQANGPGARRHRRGASVDIGAATAEQIHTDWEQLAAQGGWA
ncbi:hypothetical protein AB0A69_13775 [Streptomyces sp. NPDC045431]|uniref:hypothetical protein n=1 Tax=Streptomyces sp. NPDC045431 TaxID=3155613 RepID=UPI0033E61B5A